MDSGTRRYRGSAGMTDCAGWYKPKKTARLAAATAIGSKPSSQLFFKSDLVALEETPHCSAAACNPLLAHHKNHLIQRQVRLFLNQRQQKRRVILQRRCAPATRLGRTTAGLAKALHPFDRRTGADVEMLARLAPRRSSFNTRDHAPVDIRRIGCRHRSASQNRLNAVTLAHPTGRGYPFDFIGPKHAPVVKLYLTARPGSWCRTSPYRRAGENRPARRPAPRPGCRPG